MSFTTTTTFFHVHVDCFLFFPGVVPGAVAEDPGEHEDLAGGVVEGEAEVHGEHEHFVNGGSDNEAEEDDPGEQEHFVNGAVADDPGDDEDPEIDEFVEVDDYATMLQHLSEEWMKIELSHQVSKVASGAFWEVGKSWFQRMFQAKELQQIQRKTPSFLHIRRQMYSSMVPKLHTETGYQSKDTGIVTVVRDSAVPRDQYPPHEYSKVWEVAYVEVCPIVDMYC